MSLKQEYFDLFSNLSSSLKLKKTIIMFINILTLYKGKEVFNENKS